MSFRDVDEPSKFVLFLSPRISGRFLQLLKWKANLLSSVSGSSGSRMGRKSDRKDVQYSFCDVTVFCF